MGFHHTSLFFQPLTLKAKPFCPDHSCSLRASLLRFSFYIVCVFSRTATKKHFKHWFPPTLPYACAFQRLGIILKGGMDGLARVEVFKKVKSWIWLHSDPGWHWGLLWKAAYFLCWISKWAVAFGAVLIEKIMLKECSSVQHCQDPWGDHRQF